jgi:hypothetical protein
MKKLALKVLALIVVISFGSCTISETDIDAPEESLLKSYKLNRDASGSYSIEYVTVGNTVSNVTTDSNSKTNEFHLSKVGYDTKEENRKELTLNDNELSVGFFDAETGRTLSFGIEDENATFAKGGESTDFIKTYGVGTNEDGSFQLDLETYAGVATEFIYNEELAVYEVYLSKGKNEAAGSTENVFSRTLTVPDGGVLKIDFLYYTNLLNRNRFGGGKPSIRSSIYFTMGNLLTDPFEPSF